MFPKGITPKGLNEFCAASMVSYLGIEFTEIGAEYLKATMPVSDKTRQPLGLLHGGASVVLAESLGSVAASLLLDSKHYAVGLEINANHIRAVKSGVVTGTVRPVHVGKSTQVWIIDIENEDGKLVATSRITMAVLERK